MTEALTVPEGRRTLVLHVLIGGTHPTSYIAQAALHGHPDSESRFADAPEPA